MQKLDTFRQQKFDSSYLHNYMSLPNDGCLVVIQSQVILVVMLLNMCGCSLWLLSFRALLKNPLCHVGKIRGYIYFCTDMGHEVCYRDGGWKEEYGAPVPIS